MKKYVTAVLLIVFLLSLCGCSSVPSDDTGDDFETDLTDREPDDFETELTDREPDDFETELTDKEPDDFEAELTDREPDDFETELTDKEPDDFEAELTDNDPDDFETELSDKYPDIFADITGYIMRDLDGDGNDELIVKKVLEITVYNMKDGFNEIGSYNFRTGTLRLLESEKYPGIIVFTVGGGADRYRYMTIKEGKLVIEDVYNDYYAYDGVVIKKRYEELTTDKTLIDEAVLAYENNKDIVFHTTK